MWRVVRKLTGEAAYAGTSKHVNHKIGLDRFACWVVRNDDLDAEVPLHIYLPRNPKTCHKLIFSIHGHKRNARKYRNIFVDYLQDQNVMLIAPEFRSGPFVGSLALTMGNMLTRLRSSERLPAEQWTFTMLDGIFDLITQEYTGIKKYALFGHSAGAQFVYRFMLFHKQPNVEVAVAANPGWLTVLDPSVRFPYGIRNTFSDEELRQILARPLVLLAGEADIETDLKVRMSRHAMAQGENRFERANYAYRKAQILAGQLHAPCHWRLITVPGLAHSAKSAAPAALPYLLG